MRGPNAYEQLASLGVNPPAQTVLADWWGAGAGQPTRSVWTIDSSGGGDHGSNFDQVHRSETMHKHQGNACCYAHMNNVLPTEEASPQLSAWAPEAMRRAAGMTLEAAQNQPGLVQLFNQKGTLRLEGPGTGEERPRLHPGSKTMHMPASVLMSEEVAQNPIARMMATALDYSRDGTRRRHSGSQIFTLAFSTEAAMGPQTIAGQIEAGMIRDGFISTDAPMNKAQENVANRERFARMVEAFAMGRATPANAPLLSRYMQLVEMDMKLQIEQPQLFPAKKPDIVSTLVDQPLPALMSAQQLETISTLKGNLETAGDATRRVYGDKAGQVMGQVMDQITGQLAGQTGQTLADRSALNR